MDDGEPTVTGAAAGSDSEYSWYDLSTEATALPHARQLQQGYSRLRFAGDLEQEFRGEYWQRYLRRTRIALGAGFLLLVLFALRDYQRYTPDVWHWTVGLRLWLMGPAVLAAAALSFVPRLHRGFETILIAALALVMAGMAAAILIAFRLGATLPYEGLLLIAVFIYSISGLRFYAASGIVLGTSLAFLVASQWLGVPGIETALRAFYLVAIGLIGAVGSYSLEWSLRRNFLTEHIAAFRAARDPMTLMPHRRVALDHLDRVWRQARRVHEPIAVLMIDVDHFKAYNDHYGHLAGDGCLKEVSLTLHDRLRRPLDMAARYGGEEFIAIAYGVSETKLSGYCEALRAAVEGLDIPHEASPVRGCVTVSIGAVWCMPAASTARPSTTVELADGALMDAKRRGRNRVEIRVMHEAAPVGV